MAYETFYFFTAGRRAYIQCAGGAACCYKCRDAAWSVSLCGENGKTDLGPALGADWCEFREIYIREGSSYTAGRGIFEGEVKSMGTCADLRLTALFCALFACHAPNTHTHIKIKTNGLAL